MDTGTVMALLGVMAAAFVCLSQYP